MNCNSLTFKIIEPCDLNSLSKIAAIENEAFKDDRLSIFNLSLLARVNSIFAVIKQNTVVAEAQFVTNNNNNNAGLILGFAVAKKYQGQKIGKFMLQSLIEYARERGVITIVLTVNPENIAAINLYKNSFGFKIVDKNTCHPLNNEKRWLLEKKIDGGS